MLQDVDRGEALNVREEDAMVLDGLSDRSELHDSG